MARQPNPTTSCSIGAGSAAQHSASHALKEKEEAKEIWTQSVSGVWGAQRLGDLREVRCGADGRCNSNCRIVYDDMICPFKLAGRQGWLVGAADRRPSVLFLPLMQPRFQRPLHSTQPNRTEPASIIVAGVWDGKFLGEGEDVN